MDHMPSLVAGILLIASGLYAAHFTYRGFKDGNMTMSAIAPAHRDKQPIAFWFYTALGIGFSCLGLIGGVMTLFDRR